MYIPPPQPGLLFPVPAGAAVFTLRGERKVKEIGFGRCNLWIADMEQRLKEKKKKTDKAKRGASGTLTAPRPLSPTHPTHQTPCAFTRSRNRSRGGGISGIKTSNSVQPGGAPVLSVERLALVFEALKAREDVERAAGARLIFNVDLKNKRKSHDLKDLYK